MLKDGFYRGLKYRERSRLGLGQSDGRFRPGGVREPVGPFGAGALRLDPAAEFLKAGRERGDDAENFRLLGREISLDGRQLLRDSGEGFGRNRRLTEIKLRAGAKPLGPPLIVTR